MASRSIFLRSPSLLLVMCFCFCPKSMAIAVNGTSSAPLVPAVILFGDSIVDPGNNNDIKTIVKCNFPPYGRDFSGHVPTGRFCNGKIPGDFIASSLGVKETVPAYVGQNLSDEDLLTGVSFASGATGYDPMTPIITSVISMPDQLKLFAEYKEKLNGIAGEARADSIISESLFVLCAGSDDIANTYFIAPFRQAHYDVPSYVNLLINSATDFIQKVYQIGARRIAYVGLPPIGCLPSQRTLGGGILRDCVPIRNEAALLYNSKINEEIKRLSSNFKGTKLVYLDIYTILLDLVQRPSFYGRPPSLSRYVERDDLNEVRATLSALSEKFVVLDSRVASLEAPRSSLLSQPPDQDVLMTIHSDIAMMRQYMSNQSASCEFAMRESLIRGALQRGELVLGKGFEAFLKDFLGSPSRAEALVQDFRRSSG